MKKQLFLLFQILLLSPIYGQGNVYAIRNHDYLGYTVLNSKGKVLFELPYNSEPVFDDIIRSGAYPNAISIPLNDKKFPVKYGEHFYIVDISGSVINKLHSNTEWVYDWNNLIPRTSLIHYPHHGSFKDIFIDNNGNQKFSNTVFEDADDFLNGTAVVRRDENETWVLIDEKGRDIFDIQSKLEGDSETLYNAFHDIWSYRKASTYEEFYVSRNGVNSKSLSEVIKAQYNLDIDSSLISNQSIKISKFLFDSNQDRIFLTTIDQQRNIIQGIYDRELNRIEVAKPSTDGRYSYLRDQDDFIYGTFEHSNGDKESIVIDIESNKIVYRTNNTVQLVNDGSVLINKRPNYLIVDFKGHTLFDSDIGTKSNYLIVKDSFESMKVSDSIDVLEIRGFKGQNLTPSILKQLEFVKTLVLTECRELYEGQLTKQNLPNIENIIIKRCNNLKHYNPWKHDFDNLISYTNGFKVEFAKELELTVRNNR